MPFEGTIEATKPGQKVMLDPSEHEDLTPEELEQTYEIDKVKDGFATVKDAAGAVLTYSRLPWAPRWSRHFLPARVKPNRAPRVTSSDTEEKVHMTATQNIINLANQIFRDERIPYGEAMKKAGRQLGKEAQAYKSQFEVSASEAVMSLSSRSSANEVRAEIQRVASEKGYTAAEAADAIVTGVTANRFKERVMNLRSSGMDATTALLTASRVDPEGAAAWREAGVN